MAEIDDKKPIESVKAALYLFEQKNDQRDCLNKSGDKANEIDLLMKELASCKLKLEIKESDYKLAVAKLDDNQRTIANISAQLKLSEVEKERYMEEYEKSQAFVSVLESEYEVVIDQLVDSIKDYEELLQTVDGLKFLKDELIKLNTELALNEESMAAAAARAELAEKAVEAERARAMQSNEQLEQMKMVLDVMKDAEIEVIEKTILTDYYQSELMQAKELLATKKGMLQDLLSDERSYSMAVEAEVRRLEEDLRNTREEVRELTWQVDKLSNEIQCLKVELSERSERELETEVEIATLKSEIHKNRSKLAGAEAAEARVMSSQSGLHLAVQQLAMEAETAKREAETLKLGMCSGITISVEEYEDLIKKANMASEDIVEVLEPENSQTEVENLKLKEELDSANAEISELKLALEETARRAEMAEKAKLAVEKQLRRWREQQKQRKLAAEAVKEQSGISVGQAKPEAFKHRTSSLQEGKVFNYVPLSKFLNIKL